MRKLFTGLTVPQQYVCVSLEEFQYPLSVYLTADGNDFSIDVTYKHLFLGYKPLIMAAAVPRAHDSAALKEMVTLHFVHDKLPIDGPVFRLMSGGNCLARLKLRRIGRKKIGDEELTFYEGQYGEHSFINNFHQAINNFREKIRKQIPNNVSLPGSLYDQVRIAYAVPRIISVITVSDGNTMNMFPTDLHGPCGTEFYVSSLRHGGKANEQVEGSGRLVLSFMPAEAYKEIYKLGKNHMQDMKATSQFPVMRKRSTILQVPVPASVLKYKELERIGSFDVGIHRIHYYRVVHNERVALGLTLAHIHQYYAQWRIDHKLPSEFYLR